MLLFLCSGNEYGIDGIDDDDELSNLFCTIQSTVASLPFEMATQSNKQIPTSLHTHTQAHMDTQHVYFRVVMDSRFDFCVSNQRSLGACGTK